MSNSNNIILIEDDDSIRDISTSILERQGYTVHAFDAPQDAIDFQISNSLKLKFLMTDYYFERGTALDVIKTMRGVQENLPILIATGDREISCESLNIQHAKVLYKPFRKKELLEAIDKL